MEQAQPEQATQSSLPEPQPEEAQVLVRCIYVSTFTHNLHTKVHVGVQQQFDKLEKDKRYS